MLNRSSLFNTWGIGIRLSSLYEQQSIHPSEKHLCFVNAFAPTTCWNMGGYWYLFIDGASQLSVLVFYGCSFERGN